MSPLVDKKALELAIAAINKEFGKNTVILGDALPVDVDPIPTGNFRLDLALGIGGLPKGRIVEIFGAEALGKSLIAFSTVAEAQALGMTVAYIDAECALDPDWATHLGVDLSNLVLCQPEWGEQALQIADNLIKSGDVDLVVIDSVAALVPKAELEGDMDDQQIGLQARMMAKALRKINHSLSETNTCLIFINQIRDKIGFMQQGTTSPGGRALKFYASVRIELKAMGQIKDQKTGEFLGTRVKALVIKNKVATPMKSVEYDVLHGVGFNNFGSILELAEKYKLIIKKGGGFYYMPEEIARAEAIGDKEKPKSFAHGETQAIEFLASDLEYTRSLKEEIVKNVRGK